MARKPETTWEMLNVAMSHFQSHIKNKKNRCSLSIVDLLHVSNFKGGNASITEPDNSLPNKLRHYENSLEKIEAQFKGKTLACLNDHEKTQLIDLCKEFLALTQKAESKIRGFGPSYASALLASHFIELIPVLDRRALNGAKIDVDKDKQGRARNGASHYGELMEAFSVGLQEWKMTLRELDKKWFSEKIPRAAQLHARYQHETS